MSDLSLAEQIAVDTWNRGSADSTQMLLAVRAAIRETERCHEESDDAKVAMLVEEMAAIRDIAFRGTSDGKAALDAILRRANRVLDAAVAR